MRPYTRWNRMSDRSRSAALRHRRSRLHAISLSYVPSPAFHARVGQTRGASRPAGNQGRVPIFFEAHILNDVVGRRDVGPAIQDRGVQPYATAANAGSPQLARWLAKISAGLPSSRSCVNNSQERVSIRSGCPRGALHRAPTASRSRQDREKTAPLN